MHEPLTCPAEARHTRFRPIPGAKIVAGELMTAALMVCADCGVPATRKPALVEA